MVLLLLLLHVCSSNVFLAISFRRMCYHECPICSDSFYVSLCERVRVSGVRVYAQGIERLCVRDYGIQLPTEEDEKPTKFLYVIDYPVCASTICIIRLYTALRW